MVWSNSPYRHTLRLIAWKLEVINSASYRERYQHGFSMDVTGLEFFVFLNRNFHFINDRLPSPMYSEQIGTACKVQLYWVTNKLDFHKGAGNK